MFKFAKKKKQLLMKKITPLIIVLLFIQTMQSQTLKSSTSQVIVDLNSVACEQQFDIVSDNTFYKSFRLSDFGITSSYEISSVDYGIEVLSGAPTEGYPVKLSIYTTDDTFPNGNLTLISEVTEMITNQNLQMHSTPINATIPSGIDFVVAIYVKSDAITDGGNGQVTFQIGSNSDGEISPSYLKAPACTFTTPVTFESMGWPNVHVVMNVNGSGSIAGVENLQAVGFNYYPNPIKDKLVMNAMETITDVSLFNMLGQKVKSFKPDKLNAELDLKTLPSGTYFAKIIVNEKMGTIKLVKN
jgi:hypothetical protein